MSAHTGEGSCDLVACPHPFSAERVRMALPAGASLAEMLTAAGLRSPYAHVFVGDQLVPRELWPRVRPRAGALVTVRAVPSGGGDGKDVMRTVAMIAVVAVAAWAAGPGAAALGLKAGGVGASVLGASVGIAGNLLVNALIPPPTPKLSGDGGLSMDRSVSITGTRNRLAPYTTVPRLYGRHKLFPLLGAQPYTESLGDAQYFRQLFILGYGPLNVTEMKIGETPLEEYSGVEVEIRQGYDEDPPLTLFSNDVSEESPGLPLEQEISDSHEVTWQQPAKDGELHGRENDVPGDWHVRVTQAGAEEISVDIVAPAGLLYIRRLSRKGAVKIEVEVEYCATGSGAWVKPAFAEVAGSGEAVSDGVVRIEGQDGIRRAVGARWSVPAGQYDVRIRRVYMYAGYDDKDQWSEDALLDGIYWGALRSIRSVDPVQLKGLCKVAVRILATDQLNGVLDQFNCIGEAILPAWDGAQWTEEATSSPAWAYADAFCGRSNKRALPYSRLDGDALKEWADACTAEGLEFDAVIDARTTVFQLARDIAATGKGAFAMRDGLYSVVRDVAQAVPVQHFTPRNSWGFSGSKVFTDRPHALKVRFLNRAVGWAQDELIVYDDGYSDANATRFETLELFGVTSSDQAWKTARYHIAVARLRPETYELSADIEHLVCTRGDLVRVSHDVPLWGGGWGRLRSVSRSALAFAEESIAFAEQDWAFAEAGQIDTVELDEVVALEAGKTYVIRVRCADGTSVTAQVVNPGAGEYAALRLSAPVTGPAAGDLFMFGELGMESVECLVKSIEPGPDLTARLILVDAAPAVHDAASGEIPPFDPRITQPVDRSQLPPSAPVIVSVVSDESVIVRAENGALISRMVISYARGAGSTIPAARVHAQYRLSGGSDPWTSLPPASADSGKVTIAPVEDGETYDFRLRLESADGIFSGWTSGLETVVGKTSPPGPVAGFTAEVLEGGLVKLSWIASAEPDLDGYELRSGADWVSGTKITDTSGTSHTLPASWSGDRTFWIAPIDTSGNQGEPVSAQLTVNLPEVTSLEVQVIDNNVLLRWAQLPGTLPVAEAEIRRGSVLSTAEVIGRKKGTFTTVFESVSGPTNITYWIVPIDTAGNEGTAKQATALVNEPPDYSLKANWLSDFSGTKTNCVAEAGKLIAPVNAAETWAEHFQNNAWSTPQDQVDAGYPVFAQPSEATAQYQEVFDYGTLVPGTKVTVTPTVANVAGSVGVEVSIDISEDGAAWTAYPGQSQVYAVNFRYVRVTLDFTASDDTGIVSVGPLRISLDVKTKTDQGKGSADSADVSGTAVNFAVPFVDVESISVTPKGTTARYAIYDFEDAPNPTGFSVYLYDNAGNRVSGEFSWSARGY